MKTIRVIDLLNKIANGEEVPTFRYEGNRYLYSKSTEMFDDLDNDERCKSEIYLSELNDEIEIIEDIPKEDKKIEKLKVIKDNSGDSVQLVYDGMKLEITLLQAIILDKINEIIDRLNGENND